MIPEELDLFLVYVHEVDDRAVLCGEHALAVPRDHRVRNDTYIICPLESGKDLFRITENDRQSGCAECRIELNRFFCPVLSSNQEIVTARMRGRYLLFLSLLVPKTKDSSPHGVIPERLPRQRRASGDIRL